MDEDDLVEAYRAELAEWAAREAAENQPYKPKALWELVVRGGRSLRHPQRLGRAGSPNWILAGSLTTRP